jgi:hypothetical protein
MIFVPPGVLSGFFPTSISGCRLWLDAAERGVTSNRWDDKSGNANHFTAPSAGEFPSFSAGVATFDGSNDYLTGPDFSSFTAGEVFVRIKKDADPAAGDSTAGLWRFGSGTGATNGDHYVYSDSNAYMSFGTTARKSTGNPSQSTTVWHTLNVWSAASDFAVRTNTTTHYTTATNTVGFISQAWLGKSYHTSISLFLLGQIKQLVVYNRKLDSTERGFMDAYMAAIP